jgi:mono/diheme cytochrome c family protein
MVISGFSARWRTLAQGVLILLVSMAMFSLSFSNSWAQSSGEQLFQTTCVACHTIGSGRLVGPDLVGVHESRSQQWLEQFVKSSQTMIKNGDAEAVALAAEYSGIVMPDATISEQQIRDVLTYIKIMSAGLNSAGGESATAAVQPPPAAVPASAEDIEAGQAMFQGATRFMNGGAACNACHDVRNDAVIGGGILATELTTVFSRMGVAGLTAILGQAPFPVMQAAYVDKPLTDAEVTALVAFLEYADSEEYNQLPRDYGIGLFLSGAVGAAILFLFFGVFWRSRKSSAVNQKIYDRQVKSVVEDRI